MSDNPIARRKKRTKGQKNYVRRVAEYARISAQASERFAKETEQFQGIPDITTTSEIFPDSGPQTISGAAWAAYEARGERSKNRPALEYDSPTQRLSSERRAPRKGERVPKRRQKPWDSESDSDPEYRMGDEFDKRPELLKDKASPIPLVEDEENNDESSDEKSVTSSRRTQDETAEQQAAMTEDTEENLDEPVDVYKALNRCYLYDGEVYKGRL
jgi:hypothetical protein